MAQGTVMVARALVTHRGSREAFLATLMLCSRSCFRGYTHPEGTMPHHRCDMLLPVDGEPDTSHAEGAGVTSR